MSSSDELQTTDKPSSRSGTEWHKRLTGGRAVALRRWPARPDRDEAHHGVARQPLNFPLPIRSQINIKSHRCAPKSDISSGGSLGAHFN